MSNKLPNGWQVLELKELIDDKRSIRYGIVQPGEYDENGRYMVRGQDYSFGWVEPENLFKVSDAIEIKYKNARLKTGDIIITIVGAGTGTVAIVPDWLDGANCTQTTARIAIEPSKAYSLFCYYYLSSTKGKKLTYQNIKGGAQPGLNCGDIENFEIILPPLPEQKAIARVLSTADAAIHTTEKLIAQKELRKKWLMQQLLSGKKRLKGFKGKWTTFKMKEIGFIPEKNAIAKVDNQKLLTVKLHTKGIEFNERDKPIISSTGRPYYERNKGEILIGRQNIHNGGIGLVTDEFDGHICSNAISSFVVNNTFSLSFILFYLQYPTNYQRIEDYMGGTGQKELSEKQLLEIPIKLPESNEEQTAIAQVLQAADKEISLLKAKAEKLREQKKGLMQVLLTGKVRLKIKNI